MRKIFSIFLAVAFSLVLTANVFAVTDGFGATGLTGGTTGKLDAIDITLDGITDGDVCTVHTATVVYQYVYDDDNGTAEASPDYIAPDKDNGGAYAGAGRWVLNGHYAATYQSVNGTSINEFSIDGTGAGNSDDAVMTEKATITFVGAVTSINDADSDTKIDVEESGDEDTVRMDVGGSEAFVLNSSGRTLPLQPSFHVTKSAPQNNFSVGSPLTVTWDTETYDIGANFASNTFTAPVTGKYLLATSIRVDNLDTASVYYEMSIVTTARSYTNIITTDQFAADPAYWTFTLSVIADMSATNTATVTISQQAGTVQSDIDAGAGYTYFSGALLH